MKLVDILSFRPQPPKLTKRLLAEQAQVSSAALSSASIRLLGSLGKEQEHVCMFKESQRETTSSRDC